MLDLVSDGCLYVIYDRTTPFQKLQHIAVQMNKIPYVEAEAIIHEIYDDLHVGLDQELIPVPISAIFVSLRHCPAAAYAHAIMLLKQLAQPELPIAIAKFELELFTCSCNGIALGVKTLAFISGLEPNDIQSFQLWLLAGIQKLPLMELFKAHSYPPFLSLVSAAAKLLLSLNATATEILVTHKTLQACKHQG